METRLRSAALVLAAATVQLLIRQVHLAPYTPQQLFQCQNPKTEYFDENVNKCCNKCPPGSRLLKSCSETVDTQCTECREETYTPDWNTATLCLSCNPPCREGFFPEKECTRTQNRLCWCPPQHFCSVPIEKTCVKCQPYQKCKKGYGVTKQGTKISDVRCALCQQGTFSDVESHNASCKHHKICQTELVPGNRTHDAVCHGFGMPLGTLPALPYDISTGGHKLATKKPTVDGKEIQQTPPADISSTAGWVAGVAFAIFALTGAALACFAFRKKGQECAPPCGMEKQFSSTKKTPCHWPQDNHALCTEQQNLLQVSTSSSRSLDSAPSSEDSSQSSSTSTLKVEEDRIQSSCVRQSGANLNATPSGNGKTHVNVSCIVSVCNLDHGTQPCSLKGSAASASGGCVSAEDLLPLSKEESPIKKETGGQIAVEVEDSMDTDHHNEEEPLPLSTQEASAKTT
uniref:TNF receptor superfamily member 1B n=1 Tax=Salvator merianae TaxID=96440 RepID=A0A8D0BPX1_SALMN